MLFCALSPGDFQKLWMHCLCFVWATRAHESTSKTENKLVSRYAALSVHLWFLAYINLALRAPTYSSILFFFSFAPRSSDELSMCSVVAFQNCNRSGTWALPSPSKSTSDQVHERCLPLPPQANFQHFTSKSLWECQHECLSCSCWAFTPRTRHPILFLKKPWLSKCKYPDACVATTRRLAQKSMRKQKPHLFTLMESRSTKTWDRNTWASVQRLGLYSEKIVQLCNVVFAKSQSGYRLFCEEGPGRVYKEADCHKASFSLPSPSCSKRGEN